MNLIDLCVCGHYKNAHETSMMQPRCAMLLHKRNPITVDVCPCEEFKIDNLKYLEAMAFRNGY